MTSTDSSLLTAELTIDLEEDEGDDLPTPVEEYLNEKKNQFSLRYQPLRVNELHFGLSSEVLIGDLTPIAQEILEDHLNLEETGSMLNWKAVGAKLGMNMDSIEGMINEYGKTRGVLMKCSKIPLNRLVKALGERYSIIFTYLSEIFFVHEKKPLKSAYSEASTAIVSGGSHEVKPMPSGSILVVSYSLTKSEAKEFAYLLKHFRSDKFNTTKKTVCLLEEVVSDENVEQSTMQAFKKAEHIVFCFTPSLMDLINNAETSPTDFKSRCAVSISRMANEEYYGQKNRNTRCRAVTFEKFNMDLKTTGWANITIEYKFPTQAKILFSRIFENVVIS